jgi:hypothetical protein
VTSAPLEPPGEEFVAVVDDAVAGDLCDEVVARFLACPHRAPGRTGHGLDPARKDSEDVTISAHPEWRDALERVVSAVAPHLHAYMRRHPVLLCGALAPAFVDPATGRPLPLDLEGVAALDDARLAALVERLYRLGEVNVQRYARGRGGYHHWHSEVMPLPDGGEALHRVLFWQVYLNDVDEGGETELLAQRRLVRPRRGRLLVAPAGFTHAHKGHVPRSGDKLILTTWVMFQRAEALYD